MTTPIDLDRFESVTTADGLHAHGTPRDGWTVARADGESVAHYTQPELGAGGAIEKYHRQRAEAERATAGKRRRAMG